MGAEARPVTRRPWIATAIGICLALGLNAWTRNGLWAAYTLIGLGAFLLLWAAVRHGRLAVPDRIVWLLGTAAFLHYVGGSLSGVHQVGGANGLYAMFPWWDNVVHFVGSAALALLAGALVAGRLPDPRWEAAFALLAATTGGTLVELWEFVQFAWFGAVDQGFYTNTMVDLYNDLLGAAVGAWLTWAARRGAPSTAPTPATA